MSDVVARLLDRDDVEKNAPSPRASIDEIARFFGASLPQSLVKLWNVADGVELNSIDAHLLGPTELLRMVDEPGMIPDGFGEGVLPILDDHQSNYVVLHLKGPLAFRVVIQPHDLDSRILYREIESFFLALQEALDAGENADSFFRETQGDYRVDSIRTAEDRSAARALLRTDGLNFEWNYAVQLLEEDDLEEWTSLLNTHHFVRRDVIARMEQMSSLAIRDLLQEDHDAFEAFATLATESARDAGLEVGRREGTDLWIGGKGIILEGFFFRRDIPNAIPRMIAWLEDLIAGRNPHDRPGHFMAD